MELDKRKYKKDEVKDLLDACAESYQSEIKDLQIQIAELKEENKSLNTSLNLYKEKEELISKTLQDAQKQANNIRNEAQEKCKAEILSLKQFAKRWRQYFAVVAEKYPLYSSVKESKELFDKLCKVLSIDVGDETVEQMNGIVSNVNVDRESGFNPRSKIEDYIVATSENGFNIDEVLNPGELKLEDLCRELGLIDEN